MSPVGSAETRGRPPGCGGWATRGSLTVLGDRLATSCLYRCSASRASVLTRSPAGRRIFDAAATSQRIPAADNERASRIPSARLVHPPDGPSNDPTQRMISDGDGDGTSLALNTSPVTASIAAAATERAGTSRPTLIRSVTPGPATTVG